MFLTGVILLTIAAVQFCPAAICKAGPWRGAAFLEGLPNKTLGVRRCLQVMLRPLAAADRHMGGTVNNYFLGEFQLHVLALKYLRSTLCQYIGVGKFA
jgi:hypothetical protein